MRNYGKSILRIVGVKFWLLQCSILGSVSEGIKLLTVFVDMVEVALLC